MHPKVWRPNLEGEDRHYEDDEHDNGGGAPNPSEARLVPVCSPVDLRMVCARRVGRCSLVSVVSIDLLANAVDRQAL